MFDASSLERLALALDHAAEVALAKSLQHKNATEDLLAATEAKRAFRNGQYAADVRAGVAEIRRLERRHTLKANPSRPEWSEAFAYAKEIGFPERELRGWYDHFESNGWKVSGKAPMKDWKAGMRNGCRRWKRETGGKPAAPAKNAMEDPPRWREYLFAIGREYEPHAFAATFLKEDFRKWLNGK